MQNRNTFSWIKEQMTQSIYEKEQETKKHRLSNLYSVCAHSFLHTHTHQHSTDEKKLELDFLHQPTRELRELIHAEMESRVSPF